MGLIVQIGADLSKFEKEVNKATKDISAIGDKMGSVGSTLTKGITLPILGAGIASGKFAMDFDSAFAKVNTLLADGTDLQAYKKSLIDASSETGIALVEYTDAVQEAISSDIKQEEAIAFTTQAMKLAKGGFTQGATAVDILTTAINGYGLEADQAAHLSDVLILTQNYGKTTVDELAASMGKAIPVAANANYSMEELSTGMAVLTKNGIATAEAGTYMTSMLAELTKSGSISDTALKELAGKGFAELKKEGMSTTDILGLLNTEAVKNGKSLKDMFGNVNAANGALTIMKDTGEDYNNILQDMTTSTGAANKAAEIISATAEERLKSSFNELKNTLTELGAALLPVVVSCAEGLSSLVGWFNSLSPSAQMFMGVIIALAAAIGPLLLGFSKAIEIYKNFLFLQKTLQAANIATSVSLMGVTVPIWVVIAAIAAVIAIGYLLIKHWDEVWAFCTTCWNGICDVAKVVWGALSTFFVAVWDGIKAVFKGALSFIFDSIVNYFTNYFNTVSGILYNIKAIITSLWENIKNVFTAVLGTIGTIISSYFKIYSNTISSLFNGAKQIISSVFGVIKGIFTGDLNLILSSVKNIFGAIKDTMSNILGGAANIVKGAIDKIKGFFNFQWSLPKLKMPHFSLKGEFSLTPPSVPRMSVDWYSQGGIFTKPTVMGGIGVGDNISGRGSNAEAVLPLDKLPELLGLDKNNNTPQTITTVVQLDGREIARATSGYMDTELRRNRDGKSRANGGV